MTLLEFCGVLYLANVALVIAYVIRLLLKGTRNERI
jgi:hypothetical protein